MFCNDCFRRSSLEPKRPRVACFDSCTCRQVVTCHLGGNHLYLLTWTSRALGSWSETNTPPLPKRPHANGRTHRKHETVTPKLWASNASQLGMRGRARPEGAQPLGLSLSADRGHCGARLKCGKEPTTYRAVSTRERDARKAHMHTHTQLTSGSWRDVEHQEAAHIPSSPAGPLRWSPYCRTLGRR